MVCVSSYAFATRCPVLTCSELVLGDGALTVRQYSVVVSGIRGKRLGLHDIKDYMERRFGDVCAVSYRPTRVLCDVRYRASVWCISGIGLRACYAMSDTELAYGAKVSIAQHTEAFLTTDRQSCPIFLLIHNTNPVLTYACLITLHALYAMSGTAIGYATLKSYAMSGTDIGYATRTSYAMSGTHIG
eukprot:3461178-Rhodomonas_salina.2